MSGKSGQGHPSIPAAFTRETPERLLGRREKEPSSEGGSQPLPTEQQAAGGVHEAAKDAAKRGRTLMVFMAAQNRSVPYETYVQLLEEGVLPNGHKDENTTPAGAEHLHKLAEAEAAESARAREEAAKV